MHISKVTLSILILLCYCQYSFAQVSSAIVEFESNNQGILIPRMTTNQWLSIDNPVDGLMVYDSSLHAFYYYNGASWQTINAGPKGNGIQAIYSIDNENGSFDINFALTDMTIQTITTPYLKGDPGVGIAQTITKIGRTVTLSNNGGTFQDSILTEAAVDNFVSNNNYITTEADGDINNELQTISFAGDTLSLSHNGGKVKIAIDSILSTIAPLVVKNDTLMIDTIDVNRGALLSFDGHNWVALDPSHITSGSAGLSQSFGIEGPRLGIYHAISLYGSYPSRSSTTPFLGEIIQVGFNFAPLGWALCDGQLMPIFGNSALFSLLGTAFGGDGRTTFALPDLRGRTAIHVGTGPGLAKISWGQRVGQLSKTLNSSELPIHNHSININPN